MCVCTVTMSIAMLTEGVGIKRAWFNRQHHITVILRAAALKVERKTSEMKFWLLILQVLGLGLQAAAVASKITTRYLSITYLTAKQKGVFIHIIELSLQEFFPHAIIVYAGQSSASCTK